MEFYVDEHSNISPQRQIEEQVRVALLMGRLRPGDTLPSIRDVEAQCGVSRSIVRQAYLELQNSKILALKQGKGVLVEKELAYERQMKVIEKSLELCERTIRDAEEMDVAASSFARLLYQQALKHERNSNRILYVDLTESLAAERVVSITSHLHISIKAIGIAKLIAMNAARLAQTSVILTSYYRFEDTRKIVAPYKIDVIPLSLMFSQETRDQLQLIPPNGTMLLVADDHDYAAATFLLDSYKSMISDPSIKVSLMRMSEVKSPLKLIQSPKNDMIIFSNLLWEDLPDKIKSSEKVARPHLTIDLASLESVRMRIGVII
jgi:GntR family transcriptional regulator